MKTLLFALLLCPLLACGQPGAPPAVASRHTAAPTPRLAVAAPEAWRGALLALAPDSLAIVSFGSAADSLAAVIAAESSPAPHYRSAGAWLKARWQLGLRRDLLPKSELAPAEDARAEIWFAFFALEGIPVVAAHGAGSPAPKTLVVGEVDDPLRALLRGEASAAILDGGAAAQLRLSRLPTADWITLLPLSAQPRVIQLWYDPRIPGAQAAARELLSRRDRLQKLGLEPG